MSKLNKVQPSDLVVTGGPLAGGSRSRIPHDRSTVKKSGRKSNQQSTLSNKVDLPGKPVQLIVPTAKVVKTSKRTVYPDGYVKKDAGFKDKLIDAVFFVCPDCSYVQCSAIIIGLSVTVLLVLLFLYLGNYWSSLAE